MLQEVRARRVRRVGVTGLAVESASFCGHDHLVEFYEDESFLVDTVKDFLAPTMRGDGAAIVVASEHHRQEFEAALIDAGADVDSAVRDGRYVYIDAAATLAAFMVDGAPDVRRFRDAIIPIIDEASAGGREVRVYGEMVSMLCDGGDVRSALALEDLWNELAIDRTFTLLCAYPMRLFEADATSAAFMRICDLHATVIPAEGFSLLDTPAEQARAVARLQQQAATLRAELQRRNTEERVRLMVDRVEDYAILVMDAGGNVTTWNAGAERFKGYRSDEIIGRHLSVFYPPEDIAAGMPDRELAIAASEGRLEAEGWRVRKNGNRFWANVVLTALRDADGTLSGYGNITRDHTERHVADVALRASEERFRCSFDQALVGMMIIDIDGRYERVNDAFCSIVGYSREKLAGRSADSITHPDDLADDAAALRSLLTGRSASHLSEKRYLHASGRPVWTATNLTVIRDATGQPVRLIAQVQDITERRRHETHLQHLADHDPLTGRLNRRGFDREIGSRYPSMQSHPATGAVLVLDLDNFKVINDRYGHNAGDRLLVRIAHDLQGRLRGSDVLARFGGDEFAILLPGEDERTAQAVAASLLEVVRAEVVPELGGFLGQVTASIGVACFSDGDNLSCAEVMTNADVAMYDAKDAGRDRWSRYGVTGRLRSAPAPPLP